MGRTFNITRSVLLLICLLLPISAAETGGLTKLSEHVYAAVDFKNASPVNSFGVNTGVVIGEDGVLVIDTRISAKQAREFIADIRKVTDKPIKYVVNTHYHCDHSWGNSEFVKLGAVIIGHENGRLAAAGSKNIMSHPENFGLTVEDLNGTAVSAPTITFKDAMLVDLGGVTVSLSYPGLSHTNDSIMALVNEDSVLFAGDTLVVQYHPFFGDGDVRSWLKVLAKMESTPAKIIVPGHGPVSTAEDIKDLEVYLAEFDKQAKVLCVGKTQDDAPAITQDLLKKLPDQKREETVGAVEANLRMKYLPKASAEK